MGTSAEDIKRWYPTIFAELSISVFPRTRHVECVVLMSLANG